MVNRHQATVGCLSLQSSAIVSVVLAAFVVMVMMTSLAAAPAENRSSATSGPGETAEKTPRHQIHSAAPCQVKYVINYFNLKHNN